MNISTSNIITSSAKAPESNVLIIYTGGTLGMVHDQEGALIPFDFSSIMDHIPSLRQLELNLTVMSFENPIDSSNINPEHWQAIGRLIYENYHNYDGFVVLHGTDTMAYTASAISFMLENLAKPVIFTGAQLPITSSRSDARENIIGSLEIASAKKHGKPVVPEVCIFFDAKLFRANRAKKVESIHFDAFESENYPLLAVAGVIIKFNEKFIHQPVDKELVFHDQFDNNVALIKIFPGISEDMVSAILSLSNLRGVVIETYGSGNAPTYPWFIMLLKHSIEKGIVILNVSQCPGGQVDQGRYETSKLLEDIGVIGGYDLTTESAITKLMLMLGQDKKTAQIKRKMRISLAGEETIN